MVLRAGFAAVLFLSIAGCQDAAQGEHLSASALEPAPSSPSSAVVSAPAPSVSSAPPVAASEPTPGACSYDWIDLDEAFRSCPLLGEDIVPWIPVVRTHPKKLRVGSGAYLRFTVVLGAARQTGPWDAFLDDRCGIALRPLILDSRGLPVDDLSFLLAPSCPSDHARVTLSRRGRITTEITLRAIRREAERVVVGHRTLPDGRVENVFGTKEREVSLTPGRYFIELPLPTSAEQNARLELEVTPSPP